MSLKEVFHSVSDFFKREHIDYAVIGAFALYGYGYVRATRDIDFVIRLRDQGKIVSCLKGLGFEMVHRSDSFSNHLHSIGGVRVDIMYVEGATSDSIFSSTCEKLLFNDIPVPVVSAKHLIAMKLFAAQSNPDRLFKELSDVKEVLLREKLDVAEIKKYFLKYGLERYYDDTLRPGTQNG